jgi:tRNA modification GTPase
MDELLGTYDGGRVLREGVAVLILGRPNVGKSSLLNALLGEERAIVTDQPGTTRDTIEEGLTLAGLPLRLIDTAGVRQALDPIEAEGVRRARAKVATADLVLLVVDGSVVPGDEDRLALEACRDGRLLLVVNKADLPAAPLPPPFAELPQVRVSTHTGVGLEGLREAVAALFSGAGGVASREAVLLADRRHREALLQARSAVERFVAGTEAGLTPELLALELREALHGLGEITGETTPDEILERIFSRFCIGK